MKKNKHPKYQKVLFVDSATGEKRLIGTTMQPKATAEFEGKTYPMFDSAITAFSHPLYTGQSKLADTEGRVDRFTKRYEKKQASMKEASEKVVEPKKTGKKK